MGRWNRRYPPRSNRRNKYRDYDWSPPRETYRDPEFGEWQDNVPIWEKKFCFLAGVPWEKVLSSKKFMHCQSDILEWDDTAGKEAFENAKECYWAKLNGGKCESRIPGPDVYIEEIDWNPYIDPEFMVDLDQSFFVPDDKESRGEDVVYETNVPSFGSLKDPDWRLGNSDDPWGCGNGQSSGGLKDKATAFNQWDSPVDAQEESPNNAGPWECHDRRNSAAAIKYDDVKDNPWERGHASTSQASRDEAMGWNQREGPVDAGGKPTNHGNYWERRDQWDDNDPWRRRDRWDENDSWQQGHVQTGQLLKKEATGWNQHHNRVNAADKRSNNGNLWGYNGRPAAATGKYGSQGYHDRPGTATANNGPQGGAWSKTCDWKQQGFSNKGTTADENGNKCDWKLQGFSNKGKNADENGNKWRSGKGWQGIGESSWGHNQCEPGISRPSYNNDSNYSANVTHGGASKDPKTDWGQKQFGQYGRPRGGGFAEGREDMAGVSRKREGPGGQDVPGYKGPRLQYVNQTSRHWNKRQ